MKIFAMLLIVLNHVVQTLNTEGNYYIPFSDYFVMLSAATTEAPRLILSVLRYSGELGNTLFFVCSAWFLLKNDAVNKKKILLLALDAWVISLSILCCVLLIEHGQVHGFLVHSAMLPTIHENTWYLTCYLLFYAVHPVLNGAIRALDQRRHLRLCAASLLLYFGLGFAGIYIGGTQFFASRLIFWAIIYFVMAYMERYESALWDSRGLNLWLVLVGLFGGTALILLTNLLMLRGNGQLHSLLCWNQPCNPFILALALGAFNLARRHSFRNAAVNAVSGLSLYVYLIHENVLVRTLYRPALWQYVYERFGYAHILGWTVLLTLFVFALSLLAAALYRLSLHRLTALLCDRLYPPGAELWRRMEKHLLKKDREAVQ